MLNLHQKGQSDRFLTRVRTFLCTICGYHDDDYEYGCILGSNAVESGRTVLIFQRNV